ncbi:MAG: B12-binding domain-containing radical SAM protein [Parcubacteria group bacterium]|nr:B12-binding domain-containing radical SAM protein [Parcubacteria group bacterium]
MAKMNLIESDASLGKQVVPKKVTLIACPWTFYNEVEFRSQQLGLGYVGAYAKQFGHEIVAFIDPMIGGGEFVKETIQTKYQQTNRFGHSDEWIVSQIPADTDVIGVNAPFTDSRIVLYPLVKKIKAAFPSVPVVIGGVLATTLPREVLRESGADIVVKGEGEVAFSRILNGHPLEMIPGLVLKLPNGDIFESSQRSEQLKKVDMIPPPGYDFRPMSEYVNWSPRGNRADRTLSLISSRGCPFTCEFCSIPEKGQLWRPFTPERVLAEIKMSIEKWGVNHIEFEDDNFTLQEPRALAVLQYLRDLRKKGHDFLCTFPNGIMIDKMTENLAVLLKEAGAEIIYLPVESGDPRTLLAMDKPMAEHHLLKTLQVADWCVKAGLTVSCFFIVAYPGGRVKGRHARNPELFVQYEEYLVKDGDDVFMMGEDEKSFETTVNFCKKLLKLGVTGITPLIATPYPGTEMYEVCERFGWLAFEDDADVLTTVSYAAMNPGRVQVQTPMCSQGRGFERWQEMMAMFPTLHNVRKKEGNEQLLTGQEIRKN